MKVAYILNFQLGKFDSEIQGGPFIGGGSNYAGVVLTSRCYISETARDRP